VYEKELKIRFSNLDLFRSSSSYKMGKKMRDVRGALQKEKTDCFIICLHGLISSRL